VIEKPDKRQPVIIGGLVMGVLSSIPFVSLGNLCCCVWIVSGGALAAYLLIKRSPVLPVTSGDGAMTGVLAGVVGAVVTLVIGVPLGLAFHQSGLSMFEGFVSSINDPTVRQQMQQAIEQAKNQPMSARVASALLNWGISAVVMVGMAALGGVIGVALFEKRKGPPPPAYPPQAYPPPGYGPPPGATPNQPPY
jgi:hypothetical protein